MGLAHLAAQLGQARLGAALKLAGTGHGGIVGNGGGAHHAPPVVAGRLLLGILGSRQPAAGVDQPLVQDGDLPIGPFVGVTRHDAVGAPVLGQRLLGAVQIGLELRQPLIQPLVGLAGGGIAGIHVGADEGCRYLVDDGCSQLRIFRLERDLHQRPLMHLHHLQVVMKIIECPLFQFVLGARLLGRPGRADVGNEVLQRAIGHELGPRREVQVADDTQRHGRGLQELGCAVFHRHVGQTTAHVLNGHRALGGLEGDGRRGLVDRCGAQTDHQRDEGRQQHRHQQVAALAHDQPPVVDDDGRGAGGLGRHMGAGRGHVEGGKKGRCHRHHLVAIRIVHSQSMRLGPLQMNIRVIQQRRCPCAGQARPRAG